MGRLNRDLWKEGGATPPAREGHLQRDGACKGPAVRTAGLAQGQPRQQRCQGRVAGRPRSTSGAGAGPPRGQDFGSQGHEGSGFGVGLALCFQSSRSLEWTANPQSGGEGRVKEIMQLQDVSLRENVPSQGFGFLFWSGGLWTSGWRARGNQATLDLDVPNKGEGVWWRSPAPVTTEKLNPNSMHKHPQTVHRPLRPQVGRAGRV